MRPKRRAIRYVPQQGNDMKFPIFLVILVLVR